MDFGGALNVITVVTWFSLLLHRSDPRIVMANDQIPHPPNQFATLRKEVALTHRTIDMQTQTKFAHWNVKGENFYQLHLLFDTIAEHMEDAVDLIAERITALGGRANGTARQVASASSLKEYDLDIVAGMDHVRILLDRLAAVANASRGAINESEELEDRATSDLFTEVVRTADKDLYFLESHLHS